MSQDFKPKYAAMGAGAGAGFGPWGALIGGGIGLGIDGAQALFGDSDADAANKARMELYQELYNKYANPSPEEAAALAGLAERAKGGLTAEDKAAFLEANSQAGQFARGREGAIEQNQLMRGGGVANGGQSAVLQAQAAQDAAGRLQKAGTAQAGIASQRALQAQEAYAQQMARNRQIALGAGGMLGGAYGQSMDYSGAKDAAQGYSLDNAANMAGTLGMYYGNKKPEQGPAAQAAQPAKPAPVPAAPLAMSEEPQGQYPQGQYAGRSWRQSSNKGRM